MKFSENWLRELVPIDASHEELVERLTMSGLEVESVERLGIHLDDIVVGRIVSVEPHPDADRLKVCRVDIGDGRIEQIVCGAPNARAGLSAPLALPGVVLPDGTVIGSARLRGVDSNAMLCSARELGLEAEGAGLLELPAEVRPGESLARCLGFPDAIMELGLTPNRADCLGMRGLALEVAAEFGVQASLPQRDAPAVTIDTAIEVRLDATADCPRYCGRVIRGIDASAASPTWLTERLRRAGIRPISALVDVTNYVMIESGQPLHAFDADKLDGDIVVRRATQGETLRLLDGREVTLDADFLLIADRSKPLALAGIMGGHDSRVSDETRSIFLESAHFAPAAISGRARLLGLHTDASHRFERGVDADLPMLALERASTLLIEIAGGSAGPAREAASVDHLPQRHSVRLRRARLAAVLGIDIDDAVVERILAALGMQVSGGATGTGAIEWQVVPPAARFDITVEEDLIEEVARIHGYAEIPARLPQGEPVTPALPEDRIALMVLREQLVARDYQEAVTYTFVAPDLLEAWGMDEGSVALANPLSGDLAVMRTSLLPGLVSALQTNLNRQNERVRLFEVGRSYHADGDATVEIERIAGVACGPVAAEQWSETGRNLDFFDIKGDVESLLALGGCDAGDVVVSAGDAHWLHSGRAATLMRDGKRLGCIGCLSPRLQHALDIDTDVYVFEFDVPRLIDRRVPKARALSKFPSLRRDIAVVLREEVSFATVESVVRRAIGETLVELVLFDRYAGSNLEAGTKSLAMGLILQDRSRTLTDQDADRHVRLAVEALEAECEAKLRG